jgi:hypothetical protein
MRDFLCRLGAILDISAKLGGEEALHGRGLDEEGYPRELFCDDGSTDCADYCIDTCIGIELVR